jgi:hypothetical protein
MLPADLGTCTVTRGSSSVLCSLCSSLDDENRRVLERLVYSSFNTLTLLLARESFIERYVNFCFTEALILGLMVFAAQLDVRFPFPWHARVRIEN